MLLPELDEELDDDVPPVELDDDELDDEEPPVELEEVLDDDVPPVELEEEELEEVLPLELDDELLLELEEDELAVPPVTDSEVNVGRPLPSPQNPKDAEPPLAASDAL